MCLKGTENEGNSDKMGGSDIGNLDLGRLVEGLGLGVLCCKNDSTLTVAYASGSFYRRLGYAQGEIQALLPASGSRPVLSNEAPVDWREVAAEIRRSGYAQPELRLVCKNGHHLWASFRPELYAGRTGASIFADLRRTLLLREGRADLPVSRKRSWRP